MCAGLEIIFSMQRRPPLFSWPHCQRHEPFRLWPRIQVLSQLSSVPTKGIINETLSDLNCEQTWPTLRTQVAVDEKTKRIWFVLRYVNYYMALRQAPLIIVLVLDRYFVAAQCDEGSVRLEKCVESCTRKRLFRSVCGTRSCLIWVCPLQFADTILPLQAPSIAKLFGRVFEIIQS